MRARVFACICVLFRARACVRVLLRVCAFICVCALVVRILVAGVECECATGSGGLRL